MRIAHHRGPCQQPGRKKGFPASVAGFVGRALRVTLPCVVCRSHLRGGGTDQEGCQDGIFLPARGGSLARSRHVGGGGLPLPGGAASKIKIACGPEPGFERNGRAGFGEGAGKARLGPEPYYTRASYIPFAHL